MKTSKIVVLVLGLLAFCLLLAQAQDSSSAAGIHEIKVTAKKYEFIPSSIHVKKGERVRLVITATDHDHGIKLAAFNVHQALPKGENTTVEFTADKAGTFPIVCSHVCGFGHHGMKGELVVEE